MENATSDELNKPKSFNNHENFENLMDTQIVQETEDFDFDGYMEDKLKCLKTNLHEIKG